ncbi:unnamed protein product [Paramecium pentaurelia]|uniref:Uncharacterized protein n=1 Tax=Paramecium pentaurelia TaxID=43138 RepID=A0A8S1XUM0_9CILI|nr:unnamed protein product [Paramecium pentaurelia]
MVIHLVNFGIQREYILQLVNFFVFPQLQYFQLIYLKELLLTIGRWIVRLSNIQLTTKLQYHTWVTKVKIIVILLDKIIDNIYTKKLHFHLLFCL